MAVSQPVKPWLTKGRFSRTESYARAEQLGEGADPLRDMERVVEKSRRKRGAPDLAYGRPGPPLGRAGSGASARFTPPVTGPGSRSGRDDVPSDLRDRLGPLDQEQADGLEPHRGGVGRAGVLLEGPEAGRAEVQRPDCRRVEDQARAVRDGRRDGSASV